MSVLQIDRDSSIYVLDIKLGWVYDVISRLICIFYTFSKIKYIRILLQTVNNIFILSWNSMWYT